MIPDTTTQPSTSNNNTTTGSSQCLLHEKLPRRICSIRQENGEKVGWQLCVIFSEGGGHFKQGG